MQNKKIVFLASDCESSRWVYNALLSDFEFTAVIIEQPVSKKALFKGRVKKIGFLKVWGQTMFSVLLVPFLTFKARQRKAALIEYYQLNNNDFDNTRTKRVASVNDDTVRNILEQIQPAVVLVNGTRIISKKILGCTNALFINMHVGITPRYRGSHGGYWALYNRDTENFGTTIHIVNSGVDTGAVLKHIFARPGKEDNFTTYPVIQVAEGIRLLPQVIRDILNGNHTITETVEKGKMYYQPAIWEYLKNSTR